MARKKTVKRVVKKSTKRTAKKAPKRAAKKGSTTRKSSSNKSVDGLLKRFANQRSATEAQLASLHKTKEESEKKAARIQQQLDKLADRQRTLEADLAKLDSQRDQEVSQLLASLGVQVAQPSPLSVFGDSDRLPQEGTG